MVTKKCSFCGMTGHNRRSCRFTGFEPETPKNKCSCCYQPGHNISTCPIDKQRKFNEISVRSLRRKNLVQILNKLNFGIGAIIHHKERNYFGYIIDLFENKCVFKIFGNTNDPIHDTYPFEVLQLHGASRQTIWHWNIHQTTKTLYLPSRMYDITWLEAKEAE